MRSSPVGFYGGYRFPLSSSLDQIIAFSWRYVAPIEKNVDFDPNSGDIYAVETSQIMNTAFSWEAITAAATPGEGFKLGGGGGIMFDHAALDYRSSVLGDGAGSQAGTLASASATFRSFRLKHEVSLREHQSHRLIEPMQAQLVSLYAALCLFFRLPNGITAPINFRTT